MLDMVLPRDAHSGIAIPVIIDSSVTTRIVAVYSRGTLFTNSDIFSCTSESQGYSTPRYSPQAALEIQEKLRTKWSIALAEAKKLENLYPDPVQGMIDLLGEIPGDYDSWREIIEEPYG